MLRRNIYKLYAHARGKRFRLQICPYNPALQIYLFLVMGQLNAQCKNRIQRKRMIGFYKYPAIVHIEHIGLYE